VFFSTRLKTRLLITFLILSATTLHRAMADEWISEQHLCALTIPTHESWTSGMRQKLPAGEVLLHAVSMESSDGVIVTFVPEMPTTDLRDPAMEKQIQELLILQGWTLESGIEVTWQNRKFLQFIAGRKDALFGKQIGVARATIRAGDLFIVTAYGKGDAERANDPRFMRVIDTFHFVERSAMKKDTTPAPSFMHYHIAIVGSAGAAALLIAAFFVTMYRSRQGWEGH